MSVTVEHEFYAGNAVGAKERTGAGLGKHLVPFAIRFYLCSILTTRQNQFEGLLFCRFQTS